MICAVTDRRRHHLSLTDLATRIRDLARAGVDFVQVRERDLNDRDLLSFVRDLVALLAGTRARVLVNDRADIAIAGGAHGVHLRGDSVPARRVRAIAPDGFVVGRSVHAVEEAVAVAEDGGCDYLLFGTIFPSRGKPHGHATAGVDALADVCRRVHVPVLAIGGINAVNVASVAAAGAAGVAVVDALMAIPVSDIADTVRALCRGFDTRS